MSKSSRDFVECSDTLRCAPAAEPNLWGWGVGAGVGVLTEQNMPDQAVPEQSHTRLPATLFFLHTHVSHDDRHSWL